MPSFVNFFREIFLAVSLFIKKSFPGMFTSSNASSSRIPSKTQIRSKKPSPSKNLHRNSSGSDPDFLEINNLASRWKKILNLFRIDRTNFATQFHAKMARDFRAPETDLQIASQKQLLDYFLIGKHVEFLSMIYPKINPQAFQTYLTSKIPSLERWAKGVLRETDFLPQKEQDELVLWARQNKALPTKVLRKSHLAQSWSKGFLGEAQSTLLDAQISTLPPDMATDILSAISDRQLRDASFGLEGPCLEHAISTISESDLSSLLASLPPHQAQRLLNALLESVKKQEDIQKSLLKKVKDVSHRETQELLLRSIAKRAASKDWNSALSETITLMKELGHSIDFKELKSRSAISTQRIELFDSVGIDLVELSVLSRSNNAVKALIHQGLAAPSTQRIQDLTNQALQKVEQTTTKEMFQSAAFQSVLDDFKKGVVKAQSIAQLEAMIQERQKTSQATLDLQQNPERKYN